MRLVPRAENARTGFPEVPGPALGEAGSSQTAMVAIQVRRSRPPDRLAHLLDTAPPPIEAHAARTGGENEEKTADDRRILGELDRLRAALGTLQHPEPV